MFIFNLKLNKNLISKIFFIFMLILIISIFIYGVYVIFIKHNKPLKVSDNLKNDIPIEINEKNYANILKASNENIDEYIGTKVHIKGYVYRLIDFEETQFVIARDMLISSDKQTLVVGFLCEYKNAKDFADGTWVDITGEIKKGTLNGNDDIAVLNIISINETEKPENSQVNPPDNI